MGRFHDALQQLAHRGYFAMTPTKPIVQDIPVPSDLDEQAETSSPPSQPIEVAANLPQLQVAAPEVAGLPVESMLELTHLDQDDDQEIAIFKPIMIDAGVRRLRLRTRRQVVESEQACSDDKASQSREADVDSISPIGRLEQISDDLDSITRHETSDDVRVSARTSVGDSNVAPLSPPEFTDSAAVPDTVVSDSESDAAGVDEPIVAELADVHSLIDRFDWGPPGQDSAEEPGESTDRPETKSMVQLVQRVLGISSNDQMTTPPQDAVVGSDDGRETTVIQDSPASSIAGAEGLSADEARHEPSEDAPAERDASSDLESPYRPVLDRWAVFPDEQGALPEQIEEDEECNTVEPIVATDFAAAPSISAGSLADAFDPGEQQAQVDPPGDQAAGSLPSPPTEYEFEITARLQTPSYVERIKKLSDEISAHPVAAPPAL